MVTKKQAIERIKEIRKYGVKRNFCGSKSIAAIIEDAKTDVLFNLFNITEEDLKWLVNKYLKKHT